MSTSKPTLSLPALAASKDASYLRQGDDLMIKFANDSWLIRDYFLNPGELHFQTGDKMSVQDVFVKSTPVLLAAADEKVTDVQMPVIGKVTGVVEGPITAQEANGKTRTLQPNDPVYLHDTLITVARSYVKITLNDGTLLQLGPFSRAQLEKYTYSSETSGGEFHASIFSGIFHYISGKIGSHHQGEHTLIKTPSANIGIRGSEVEAEIGTDGSTTLLHLEGVITVTSRYLLGGEEEVIYERGTTVYIPMEAMTPRFDHITEEQIQERGQRWQSFSNEPQIYERMPPEEVSPSKFTSPTEPESEKLPSKGPEHERVPPPFSPLDTPEEHDNPHLKPPPLDRPAEGHVPGQGGEGPPPPPLMHRQLEEGRNGFQEKVPDQLPPPAFQLPANEHPNPPSKSPPPPLDVGKPVEVGNPPPAVTQNVALREDETAQVVSFGGEPVSYTKPAHGQVASDGNGTLTYQPDSNFNGEDTFTYFLADHKIVDVKLTIAAVNDPPIILKENPEVRVNEDGSLVISAKQWLSENVKDVDGDVVSIVKVAPVLVFESMSTDNPVKSHNLTHGEVFLNDNGDIVYSPAPDYHGKAEFTYTVADQNGAEVTGTVTVLIAPVNDHPQAIDDVISITTRAPLTIATETLIRNDLDVDGDSLSLTEVLKPSHAQVSFVDHRLVFIPDADFQQGGFDYVVSDGQLTDQGAVSIQLSEDLPPVALNDTVWTPSALTPIKITYPQLLSNDFDPEQSPLEITHLFKESSVAGDVGVDSEGNIVFTPAVEFIETHQGGFTYQISDARGNLATASVTILLQNLPPQANHDQLTINQLAALFIDPVQLLANDVDPEMDPLQIISLTAGPNGSVGMDENQQIIFMPSQGLVKDKFGSFTYQVSDGNGHHATAMVTIHFANQPVVANDDTIYLNLAAPTPILLDQLLHNDQDPDQDPLTLTHLAKGSNGDVKFDENGNLVFTPEQISLKQGDFTYEVTDGQGHRDTARVTVEFQDQSPIANPDNLKAHQSLIIPAATLLANDVPIHDLKITQVVGDGQVQLDGNLVFTPTEAFFSEGKGEFTYEVTDRLGQTASALVTVTLINSLPVIAGQPHEIGVSKMAILPANQLVGDADGDSLILKPTATDDSVVTLDGEGNVLFTRGPNFDGSSQFWLEVDDQHGGVIRELVTVNGHFPPAPTDDQAKTTKNTSITIPVLLNDFDKDPGDTLTVSSFSQPLQGLVTQGEATDQVTFTPANNFTGKTTFNYTVTDSYGVSEIGQVTVEVNNTPPVAIADAPFETLVNEPLKLAFAELVGNDIDKDPGDQVSVVKVDQAINGSVSLEGDTVVFTPTRGFLGEGSFSYTIADRSGAQASSPPVMVTVLEPVVANDDKATVAMNTPLILPNEKLLANDTGNGLSISAVDQAIHGQVALQGSQVTFTPASDFIGEASFAYTITGSSGDTDTATVTVKIESLPPIVTLPNAATVLSYTANQPAVLIDPGASVSDPDSPNFDLGELRVTVSNHTPWDMLGIQNSDALQVSNSNNGTITVNGNLIGNFFTQFATGDLVINLNENADASATSELLRAISYQTTSSPSDPLRTVAFTLTDGDGGTSETVGRDVSIMVEPPLIKANDDHLQKPFNVATLIDVNELLSNDTVPNPADLPKVEQQFSNLSAGVDIEWISEKEIRLFVDGVLHDNFDSIHFDYTVTDGQNNSATATVTVTPNNVILGTSNDDSLLQGSDQMEILLGKEGNDSFAPSVGADILLGGEGNDVFWFNPTTASGATLDGGSGDDVLRLEAANISLDLIKNDQVSEGEKFHLQQIESIDLSGQNNQLRLHLQDVLDVSGGHLIIDGDSSNIVASTGQGWQSQGIDAKYHLYTGSEGAELLVSTDIALQFIS